MHVDIWDTLTASIVQSLPFYAVCGHFLLRMYPCIKNDKTKPWNRHTRHILLTLFWQKSFESSKLSVAEELTSF